MDIQSFSEKSLWTSIIVLGTLLISEGRKMWKTYLYSKKLTNQLMNAPEGQMLPIIADQISRLRVDRDDCLKENSDLKIKLDRIENSHKKKISNGGKNTTSWPTSLPC